MENNSHSNNNNDNNIKNSDNDITPLIALGIKYMYTLHRQKKRKFRHSPGTKICKSCLGLKKY